MKCLLTCICMLTLLLSACNQGPLTPEKFDAEKAATAWNTPDKTWSESDLFLLEQGRRLYSSNCSACHQSTGEGQLSFGAPALKGSALAMGNVDPLVTIVLNGRNGMPAFRGRIDAPDLAAILTYMRNAWGNNAMETIQTATVAALMQ